MVRNKLLTKDDLLDILAEFYHERLRPDFEKVNKGLDKMESRLEKVKKRDSCRWGNQGIQRESKDLN